MKKQRYLFFKGSLVWCLYGISTPLSSEPLGYTADYFTDTIYSFNLQTGGYAPLLTIPGGVQAIDLQALYPNTLYFLGFTDRNLYSVNVADKTYSLVTSTPIGDSGELVYGVAIGNAQTAYVVGYAENKVYSVDLSSGASTELLTIPGSPGLTNIVMPNSTTLYVVGYLNNNIYRVDLLTNTSQLLTPVPLGFPSSSPAPEGIALVDDDTAYVVGNQDGNVYRIDLQTGSFSLVTPSPIGGGSPIPLINLAIEDGMGYTVNNLGGEIYKINLSDGSFTTLANIFGTNLTGMTLLESFVPVSQIPINNLTDNNLRLANYLNVDAPAEIISLFSELGADLTEALEATNPTRNSSFTYAAQLGSLAFNRQVRDHERQKRFQHQVEEGGCRQESPYTVWVAPWGGYTKIQAERQTPFFDMGSGGVTAAWDYNGRNRNLLGVGAAYLYTTVHEKHAGGGHVDQGFLSLYSTFNRGNFYSDGSISGSIYRAKSKREISFPGVKKYATAHPQGFQFTPSIEIGYNRYDDGECTPPAYGISPFLFTDWVATWEQKLRERGATGFNMGQKSRFCSLLHSETGFRFHETVTWEGGKALFREKIAYSYQKAFGTGKLDAFLIGSPGHFTVTTLAGAQNLGVVELSILFLADRSSIPYLDIWYEGEFGAGYQLHQAVIEIGKNF